MTRRAKILLALAVAALCGLTVQSARVLTDWASFEASYREFFAWVVPTIVLSSLLLWSASKRRREAHLFRYRAVGDHVHGPAAQLPEQLRHRAMTMRRDATTFLVLLFVVIGATLAIYTFAERIVDWDPVSYTIQRLESAVGRLRRGEPGDVMTARRMLNPGFLPTAVADIDETAKERLGDAELDAVSAELEELKASQLAMQSRVRDLDFVAVLATRIGAVVILVFLAHFLINGYRYSMRLAAAYESRADALTLWSGNELTELEQAQAILSVDTISFGSVPSPTEQGVEIAKELLKR